MEQFKRHSLAAMGRSKDKEKENRKTGSPSPATRVNKPANTLDLAVESPPAVFYGNATQSTGALYAGQLRLTVTEPEITLTSFDMRLNALITTRKPVGKDCPECIAQSTQLKEWNFITHSKSYPKGTHSIPFSYLIPGHLPVTTHGDLGMCQYFLVAHAAVLPKPNSSSISSAEHSINMRRELPIARAVRPLDEKISLRIFPPTNLTARVTHFPIIHPIGDFNIQMQLSGIRTIQTDVETRWRLRKMIWRLEEVERMVSPACRAHAAKIGGEGKGIAHEDTRTIGRGDLKSGWKTDLSEGTIEMEFVARPSGLPRALCDVESPTGLSITHSLVIELIIAEEWAPLKHPERGSATGAARVLRMQFAVVVTERSGMGIAWDEEQPPMYEDVPESPPMYPVDKGTSSNAHQPETSGMMRTRSEIVNYTGTPLGPPPPFEEEEAEFEGLTLGPLRIPHAQASPGPSSSRPATGRTPSGHVAGGPGDRPGSSGDGGRGRSRLTNDDFVTDADE